MWRWVAAMCLLACGVPAPGRVLVTVDTDMPKPSVLDRLRIDLYRSDGTWYESREFPLLNKSDWPASFGIATSDFAEHDLYARFRLYPQGEVRDYRGEAYVDHRPYGQVSVSHSIAEMCDQPLEAPLGQIVTARRGRIPFITSLAKCTSSNMAGSFAAYVDIDKPGSYTFAALSVLLENLDPKATFPFPQVTLQLRRDCARDDTAIACDEGQHLGSKGLPIVHASFSAPTRVWMIVGGNDPRANAVDVSIAAWLDGAPVPRLPPRAETPPPIPFEMLDARRTPRAEPNPEATIDRLVKIHVDAEARDVRVVLRGACAGHMSKLGEDTIDLSNARTCIDDSRRASKISLPDDPKDIVPFFQPKHCPQSEPDDIACLEGGVFVLGGRETGAWPTRIAAVDAFEIDRSEVSNAAFREALETTIKIGGKEVALRASDFPFYDPGRQCLYSNTLSLYDDRPVACLSYFAARAYCIGKGGDLPTEAQWEYAATIAGKDRKTLFPWGDDVPQCECTNAAPPCHAPRFGRGVDRANACGLGATPTGVSENSDPVTGDITPNGIINLAGNRSEWTRDALHLYDDDCWASAGVLDPACIDREPIAVSVRGMAYDIDHRTMVNRLGTVGRETWPGFRCAYPLGARR